MSTISGIQAISLFQRSSGIVVQKNRIVANQGEAMLQNMIAEEDALGRELFAGDESVMEFACYDTAGNDQLEAWAEADTQVELVTAGLQENVLWYEPATIKVIKPFSFATKNRNYTRIRISKSGGAHKVWRGINLLSGALKLQGFETGWQDSNSDDIADGFAFINTPVSKSFSAGIQTAEFSTGSNVRFVFGTTSTGIIYPVAGLKLTVSNEFTQVHPNTINNITLSFRDRDGSSLSSSSETVSSPARDFVTATTPADIWYISAEYVVLSSVSGNGEVKFKEPAVRTDGKSTYVAY